MSPEEAYAAAVDASGAGVSAIFVTGDPAQMLRAALASLRVSGYVVVPVEPTEARLYEIGGEISRMIEGRVDDIDMAMALYMEVISGAPVFPPEADHG
jgi:hypothetical protein